MSPRMRPPLGVRTKLVLGSLVLLLVVSFAFTAAFLWLSQAWVEDDLRGRAIAFAREVAASIGDRRELENTQLLRGEIRRILDARQTVRNIDILAFDAATGRLIGLVEGHRTARVNVRDDPKLAVEFPVAGGTRVVPARAIHRFLESAGYAFLLTP